MPLELNFKSWEPCLFNKVAYCCRAQISNIHGVREKGTLISMSQWPESDTYTEHELWFFSFLLKALSVSQCHYVVSAVRVLCPFERQVAALDCILSRDSSLVLAAGQRPEINSRAHLWVLIRLSQCRVLITTPAHNLPPYFLPQDPLGWLKFDTIAKLY